MAKKITTDAGVQLTRMRKVEGYAAWSRMHAFLGQPLRSVPTILRQPYTSSPDQPVYTWRGVEVIAVETAHRRYAIYRIDHDPR